MIDCRPAAPRLYILDGHEPALTDNPKEWARLFAIANRQVGVATIGNVRISTVFLGLDHDARHIGRPRLFETMIFGGAHDQYQKRCCTWDEAEAMHARALALVSTALH